MCLLLHDPWIERQSKLYTGGSLQNCAFIKSKLANYIQEGRDNQNMHKNN